MTWWSTSWPQSVAYLGVAGCTLQGSALQSGETAQVGPAARGHGTWRVGESLLAAEVRRVSDLPRWFGRSSRDGGKGGGVERGRGLESRHALSTSATLHSSCTCLRQLGCFSCPFPRPAAFLLFQLCVCLTVSCRPCQICLRHGLRS